jgi:hypothetical protein
MSFSSKQSDGRFSTAMNWAVVSAVFGGQGKNEYAAQRSLQPMQAVVPLSDESNLAVDVTSETPLSDWRRIDR